MMREIIPDVVRGHEIWFEHDEQHMNIKNSFKCKLLFGHNMVVDGAADVEKVKAAVFNPLNRKSDLEVYIGNSGLTVKFDPIINEHHIIAAEYDAGIYTVTEEGWQKGLKNEYVNVERSGYYYQYAKTIISGHGPKQLNPVIGHELEIIPVGFGHYHAGEKIGLQVLYDGSALADAVIIAAISGNEGYEVEAKTDAEGKTSIELDQTGNWMFKVRHVDPDKGVEDQYDEKVITAVLTVMGVH
jgi:uncharacterized GH25 family protein